MEEPLLQVSKLKKDYRTQREKVFSAVRGISFEVDSGECFGLLGPNGAGKSTTIKCITGFYPVTEGKILVGGYDVYAEPKAARRLLGVCFQEDTLDTDFNVLDQLVRHATFFRIGVREARKRAAELVERFEVQEKANNPVEQLSGGMRRRLQVARALMSEPKVLVLDEPTTGLDPEARRILWRIISECRSRGVATLLSTHYMDEAQRLCNRIAILHRGVILDVAPPDQLIRKHIPQPTIRDEVRPGLFWDRPANLEDVYLKLTGRSLEAESHA